MGSILPKQKRRLSLFKSLKLYYMISFALEDNEQYYVEGMPRSLGDIFISYDHACAQAKEYGQSLKREMCFLMTHGLLHLLGYDHMNEDEEKEMFSLQKEILNQLGIERG